MSSLDQILDYQKANCLQSKYEILQHSICARVEFEELAAKAFKNVLEEPKKMDDLTKALIRTYKGRGMKLEGASGYLYLSYELNTSVFYVPKFIDPIDIEESYMRIVAFNLYDKWFSKGEFVLCSDISFAFQWKDISRGTWLHCFYDEDKNNNWERWVALIDELRKLSDDPHFLVYLDRLVEIPEAIESVLSIPQFSKAREFWDGKMGSSLPFPLRRWGSGRNWKAAVEDALSDYQIELEDMVHNSSDPNELIKSYVRSKFDEFLKNDERHFTTYLKSGLLNLLRPHYTVSDYESLIAKAAVARLFNEHQFRFTNGWRELEAPGMDRTDLAIIGQLIRAMNPGLGQGVIYNFLGSTFKIQHGHKKTLYNPSQGALENRWKELKLGQGKKKVEHVLMEFEQILRG